MPWGTDAHGPLLRPVNSPAGITCHNPAQRASALRSHEEAYEALCFDMQVRHAVGVRDLGEEVLAPRTVCNVRRALARRMEETAENLFEGAFRQVTGEQQQVLDIKSSSLRMDSTQIASNIRTLSRLAVLGTRRPAHVQGAG